MFAYWSDNSDTNDCKKIPNITELKYKPIRRFYLTVLCPFSLPLKGPLTHRKSSQSLSSQRGQPTTWQSWQQNNSQTSATRTCHPEIKHKSTLHTHTSPSLSSESESELPLRLSVATRHIWKAASIKQVQAGVYCTFVTMERPSRNQTVHITAMKISLRFPTLSCLGYRSTMAVINPSTPTNYEHKREQYISQKN